VVANLFIWERVRRMMFLLFAIALLSTLSNADGKVFLPEIAFQNQKICFGRSRRPNTRWYVTEDVPNFGYKAAGRGIALRTCCVLCGLSLDHLFLCRTCSSRFKNTVFFIYFCLLIIFTTKWNENHANEPNETGNFISYTCELQQRCFRAAF